MVDSDGGLVSEDSESDVDLFSEDAVSVSESDVDLILELNGVKSLIFFLVPILTVLSLSVTFTVTRIGSLPMSVWRNNGTSQWKPSSILS